MENEIVKTLKGTKRVGGTLNCQPINFNDESVRYHYKSVLVNKEESLQRKEFSDKALDESVVKR
jgi:hypothetical protein